MKLHEEFKLYENMWEEAPTEETTKPVEAADNFDSFDFGGYMAGTTTYDIIIDGSDKKTEGTCAGPEALRKILEFINGLTQEEKDNLGLGWWWDAVEPGDCDGDTIVYVVAPSEDDGHWGGRSGSNLPEAEVPIRKALGISLGEPNILMESTSKTDTRVLTEATDGDGVQNSLQALVDDINNEVAPSHQEINKVIISKKSANTVIVITNLNEAEKDKGEALKKDINAKVFNNKDLKSIGITFTEGTSMPLRLAYTISDGTKFSAFYNGSSENSSENNSAEGTTLSVDKVKGIELLESEADKKGIAAIVNKINSTALKNTVSGLTLSKGEDFLAFALTVPATAEEKTITSLMTTVPKWFAAIGWKYSASEPTKTTKDDVIEIKFKPLYKKFF